MPVLGIEGRLGHCRLFVLLLISRTVYSREPNFEMMRKKHNRNYLLGCLNYEATPAFLLIPLSLSYPFAEYECFAAQKVYYPYGGEV